ncbi:cytochrome oxidase maturation protein, cbb3-type [Novosphingobium nitrogenifigens DSM 19370]|uniref:Cytochrome oxidase maturation protein, cbb3-type n=1 Tax=Novosphingobium nitrogenifigens DSM 19370 TaxID=983920 RepID=F1Z8B0_9SPHN|nr:cbb3-type cytochrome oxidase assembly protein CcoS [Novosphingobium nitrogenifigens]EGD59115.1 cytochrome oxidase maturation protein, cbb3-type [Novosphingobium nitrogenifigens DSM 19370]
MTSIAFLIPIALGMGLFGLASFFWALKRGQFNDLDGAAARILIDDDGPEIDLDKKGEHRGGGKGA